MNQKDRVELRKTIEKIESEIENVNEAEYRLSLKDLLEEMEEEYL